MADVQMPLVDGRYEIKSEIEFKNPSLAKKETTLIAVVDPEGYVYQKYGNQEVRIIDAEVTLYQLKDDKREIWRASDFQQQNPQATNRTGKYTFLVPPGKYYLEASADGYKTYKGEIFEVTLAQNVHINIQLKSKLWRAITVGLLNLAQTIINP